MHSCQRKTSATFLALLILLSPMLVSASHTTRSTTVWSGTVSLPEGYHVASNEVLVIQAGSTVLIGDSERIVVDGRLSIEGTTSSQVLFQSISGDHEGLQFNSSSKGKNSVLDNLTITDSVYGITIFGSDPQINNLTVINADRVSVDMFDGASPLIRDLVIEGGGQDIHGATLSWRYGIGLSFGSGSAPIVQNAKIDGLVTRGVNVWANGGGLLDGLVVSNISGATLAAAAGIWVEDSIPLFSGTIVQRSDNGVIVRHQSPGFVTRPTFIGLEVEDSQNRGILVERYDHTNFSNLETNAIFEGLVLRGTGGPGAITPGLGIGAAFDVNTSGARVTDALIEDNALVGFRAYTTDSSTALRNITLRNNGPTSPATSHDGAGILFRSTSWTSKGPATVYDIVVENSSGAGVHMAKGGVIGGNWTVQNNGDTGVAFVEFHPRVENLFSQGNSRHGVSVIDSSNVELSYLSTTGNGLGSSEPEDGAGIFFRESNYVMSGGKNVSCIDCSSTADQHGIVIRDSVDIQLLSTSISDALTSPALDIDNSGSLFQGSVLIEDMAINSNSSGTYSAFLNNVDAEIRALDLSGNSGGLFWSGRAGPSILENSVIWESAQHCLDISGHPEFIAADVSLYCENNSPTIDESVANFTSSTLTQSPGSTESFILNSSSHLRWISSGQLADPGNIELDNIVDLMWVLDVHTINQNLLNIPFAIVNVSFDSYEDEINRTQPYEGYSDFGPFVGKRWTPLQGWSQSNSAYVGCDYDGVHNDTLPISIDQDQRVYCRLELTNQPPFIEWSSPEEAGLFSSGSEVIFDASTSWDLDFDDLSFSWSSSIDGDLIASCGPDLEGNFSNFIANDGDEICLSDGLHQITLEICDSEGHCVNETREIELVNLPPVLYVGTTPSISSWGTLFLGETAEVIISLSGTYDPEGGDLWCWLESSYESGPDIDPDNPHCPEEIVRSFTDYPDDEFTVSVVAYDGVNPPVLWTFDVELYNEIPEANLDITRNGPTSADWVRLDGSNTTDPEGDDIRFEFHSNLDGLLYQGATPEDPLEWVGTLSKGTHSITMMASDIRSEHGGQWNLAQIEVDVLNSPPRAQITHPSPGITIDSSEILTLDSTGSGDWDLACSELENNGSGLLCNPSSDTSKDLVSVLWLSDLLEEPLGGGWELETRLPSGEHTLTLSIDDGSGIVTDEVSIIVEKAAPSLVLDSPIPGIEVYSNLPVLFDFRNSIDYDGDEFTVSVTSDLMGEILVNKSTEFWYNDYLVAGNHNLTFILTDDDGMQRTHSQSLVVLETGPVAVISGLQNGQYLPPGEPAIMSAEGSFDYDGDIVLYEWTIDGSLVSDSSSVELSLPPGPTMVQLLVQDSRGATSTVSINLTIGYSVPTLHDLTASVLKVEENKPTDVTTTVRMEDPDSTSDTVRGQLTAGGISQPMYFYDDGTSGDLVAGDNIWTSQFTWVVSGGSWVRVDVWAVDGEFVSTSQSLTIPIEESTGGLSSWIVEVGIPILILSMAAFAAGGIVFQRRKMMEIAKDMEVIESWSSFDPRELDEEFDADED